jgi:hypothetical protein
VHHNFHHFLLTTGVLRYFPDSKDDEHTFKMFHPTFEGDVIVPFGNYVKARYGAFSDITFSVSSIDCTFL